MDENPASASRRAGSRAGGARVTERDRILLAFMAEHRLVLSSQVQALLGISPSAASKRLAALRKAGYVEYVRKLYREPGCYQISRDGLGVIASPLRRPAKVDLALYQHDVGLASLWVAARSGIFGPLRGIVSERRMRSEDGVTTEREPAWGVRLGGVGPGGRDRLHYPDLILETESGHRVALELELSSKSPRRRDRILAGYASERRIDAVVYLVQAPSIGHAIAQSARRMGISHLMHVQRVSLDSERGAAVRGRTAEREPRSSRGGRAALTSAATRAGPEQREPQATR